MLRAALVEPAPERVGRRVAGERRGADGLGEERGDGAGPGLGQHAVEGVQAAWPDGSKRQLEGGMCSCGAMNSSYGRRSPGRPVSPSVAIVGPW